MAVRPSRPRLARTARVRPAVLVSALWLALAQIAHAESPTLAATQLDEVIVNPEQDDFDARHNASSTKLVYGRKSSTG